MKTAYDDHEDEEREREQLEWLTLSADEERAHERRTLQLVWGSVAVGVLVPVLAACLSSGVSVLWRDSPFLLLALISNAIPFAVYAVCVLLYLGFAPAHGRLIVRRRWRGVLAAGVPLTLMSVLSYTGLTSLSASVGHGLWSSYLLIAVFGYLLGTVVWEMLDKTFLELFLPENQRRR